MLSFTADEIWLAMPHGADADGRNVCLNDMPAADSQWALTPEEEARWDVLLRLRGEVNKALELARAEKLVGKPLDARVTLFVTGEAESLAAGLDEKELAQLCIVSELRVIPGPGQGMDSENVGCLTVHVEPSDLPRCERCWTHEDTVGKDPLHPTLCARCAAAVG